MKTTVKTVFKNHATKLKVVRNGLGYSFHESHLTRFGEKVYPTRKQAEEAMQRYSKKHYGERAR